MQITIRSNGEPANIIVNGNQPKIIKIESDMSPHFVGKTVWACFDNGWLQKTWFQNLYLEVSSESTKIYKETFFKAKILKIKK
jgi:hypothetical protein